MLKTKTQSKQFTQPCWWHARFVFPRNWPENAWNHCANHFCSKSSKATTTNTTNQSTKIFRKVIQFKSQWFWSSWGHHIPCKAIPVDGQILGRLCEHWGLKLHVSSFWNPRLSFNSGRLGSKQWFGSLCKMRQCFIPQNNDHVTHVHTFPAQHHWTESSLLYKSSVLSAFVRLSVGFSLRSSTT